MRNFILLLIIFSIYSTTITAQYSDYEPKIIIIKVDCSKESEFQKSENFDQLHYKFGNFHVKKEFPDAIKPPKETNSWGKNMVDITTIYRIVFENDINVFDVIAHLKKNTDIIYSEPLYIVNLLEVPNDPINQTDQYWLNKIKSFDAWNITQGDTSVVIGISDTGTGLTHEDLEANLKLNYIDIPDGIDNDNDGYIDNYKGWNFADDNNNTQVTHGFSNSEHGAYVSGIAAAVTNNGIGVSGAGYKSKFVPLRIMNETGMLTNTYQSIVYAANHNFDVVNCSWGSKSYQQMGQDVVNYATINHDVLIVAAAGNDGIETKFYPASFENVLSVAGTDSLDAKWSGSSYSTTVDVSAPSTMFLSTSENGYTTMWGGTSFASPIVAGSAAILRSYYPDYNALQITELIRVSADNIDTLYNFVSDSVMSIDSIWVDTSESFHYDTIYQDISHNYYFNQEYSFMLGGGRLNLYNALINNDLHSVRFENITSDRQNNSININGVFVNYLNSITNLSVSLNVDNQYVTIENSSFEIGDMQTLDTYSMNNPIVLIVAEDAPNELTVKLKITYTANEFYYEQVIDVLVNGGFVDISTLSLNLSVAGNGRLGHTDLEKQKGHGFYLDNYYELFSDCAVISGISETEIYSAVQQISDFNVKEFPHIVDNPTLSDNQVLSKMSDSLDYNSKNIEIVQNLYTWNSERDQHYILLDFNLINNGAEDIQNYYFGLFTDWDLVEFAENNVAVDEENNFVYCKYDGENTMYAGIKLLSTQISQNYVLPNKVGGDGIIDITDGFGDLEKFYMVSNTSIYQGAPYDLVFYTGAGPFNIPSNDTVNIGFAIIAAESYFDMKNAISAADNKYNENIHPMCIGTNNTNTQTMLFPNPVSTELNIKTDLTNYKVSIFNNLGVCVLTDENVAKINLNSLKAGIYTIIIANSEVQHVEKIIKIEN